MLHDLYSIFIAIFGPHQDVNICNVTYYYQRNLLKSNLIFSFNENIMFKNIEEKIKFWDNIWLNVNFKCVISNNWLYNNYTFPKGVSFSRNLNRIKVFDRQNFGKKYCYRIIKAYKIKTLLYHPCSNLIGGASHKSEYMDIFLSE